jgi:hypothetical protein
MKKLAIVTFIAIAVSSFGDSSDRNNSSVSGVLPRAAVALPPAAPSVDDGLPWTHVAHRRQADLTAMEAFRPGYTFWKNIYTIPDGSVVFGSAADGRRLAVFSTAADWTKRARWDDPALANSLDGLELPKTLDDRREYVALLLNNSVGPVLHNFTRGTFLKPGIERYGTLLGEWGAIYERFGVPAEIGLAQALVESGFVGLRRSEADAVGLCQWLDKNWKRLDTLDPAVLEDENQTTQAAYCAAYLSVLATKYGSFIPALSAHHAGGTNIGRVLVNGERLGGKDARQRYLLGAQLARDLRTMAPESYSDVYGSYGPRSYRYAEMIFGNTSTVTDAIERTRQVPIFAMRTSRSIPIEEITRHTHLSADEVKRFNPALVKRVPEGGTLYLPMYVPSFGRDVTFWRRPAGDDFTAVLNDLVRLDAAPEEWDTVAFGRTLREFEKRFLATSSEEGTVMATILAYVRGEASNRRREILADFRASADIQQLFQRGVRELETGDVHTTVIGTADADLSR